MRGSASRIVMATLDNGTRCSRRAFILSAGDEEKIKKAIHTIRFAIVGLIVSFIGFFAVRFLAHILDIPFNLTFSDIVDLMDELLDAMS